MIPWEKGWTVTVDGEKVQTQKGDLGFSCISVDKGEHQLELTYQVPGLKAEWLQVWSAGLSIFPYAFIRAEKRKEIYK